jgi:glutaredoxin 3
MSVRPDIVMYSTTWCAYCVRARSLLDRKGVAIQEIKIDEAPDEREHMLRRCGERSTVPQIFIRSRHVGGYDALVALERSGELDAMLASVG